MPITSNNQNNTLISAEIGMKGNNSVHKCYAYKSYRQQVRKLFFSVKQMSTSIIHLSRI